MFNGRYVLTRYFVFSMKLSLLSSRNKFVLLCILWSHLPGLGESGQLSSTFISVDSFPDASESLYFIFRIIENSCKSVVGCYLAVLQNKNFAEFVIFPFHPHA
jgi:hypothetical protein